MKKAMFFSVLILASILWSKESYAQFACKYVKSISGDTIIANCGDEERIIRLYGIDAPDIGQVEHDRSSKFLDEIMKKNNTYIICHRVGKEKKDRYGRINAVVYKDGVCANREMVEKGMAFVAAGDCRIDKCQEWKDLEKSASSRKDNIWFLGGDEKPWEFREKSNHLAGKNQGYFEDVFYMKEGEEIVAYETKIPDEKVYAPIPPTVVYVPYPTNQTIINNVNQNQVNVRR